MADFDEATLADLLRRHGRGVRVLTHTIKPGIVESYEALPRPSVTVTLGQIQVTATGDQLDYPPVSKVPVIFPTFGSFTMRSPLKKGNGVLCFVCDRSFDQWMLNGGAPTPGNGRLHHPNDIVALAGFNPNDREPKVGTTPDELFIGDVNGTKTTIVMNSNTGAVTVKGVNVTVEASGTAKVKGTRIELDAFAGLPGGPFNLVGVNSAGLCTHVTSVALAPTGTSPVVWIPNGGLVVIP